MAVMMLPWVPDIGDSIFALNYLYGPCYFAWYQALRDMGFEKQDAMNKIWQINEDFVKTFPKPLRHWIGNHLYLGTFRRKAVEAERRGKMGQLHPSDWRIEYVNIDQNTFAINILDCAMLKLADQFGYRELFPHVCRMDYLFSHYFNNASCAAEPWQMAPPAVIAGTGFRVSASGHRKRDLLIGNRESRKGLSAGRQQYSIHRRPEKTITTIIVNLNNRLWLKVAFRPRHNLP